MLIDKKLEQWAGKIREEVNLPACIKLWTGQSLALGHFEQPLVTITINSAAAIPSLIDPSLTSLGEAYIEKRIDLQGNLKDIIAIGYQLASNTSSSSNVLTKAVRYLTHTKSSDKQSIQYHYDVSNEFYQQWLDPNMVYTCAYFENGDEDLATAQLKKIDHILTKIDLQPGQTLLDIGCGWGALVIRAAQKFGAKCVGVTLSQNQYDLAVARVKAAGLENQIEIRIQDYRDVPGQFDRITSVGMFEHVGRKNLPEYFTKIHDLLKDDGVFMNHGITSTDSNSGDTAGGEFIDRYVFPNGELPHLSLAIQTMQEGGLEAYDIENLRRHYAKTLAMWSDNFEANSDKIRELVDEKKFRIWRVYLAGCSYAFEQDDICIYQIVGRKAGLDASVYPWSRRYMYK